MNSETEEESRPSSSSGSDDEKSENEKILREGIFTIHYPEADCEPASCQVTLSPSELILDLLEEQDESGYESDSGNGQERFPVEDIFGFHILQKNEKEQGSNSLSHSTKVYACIVFYSHDDDTETSSKCPNRTREVRLFEINESQRSSYEENLKVAREWALDIANLLFIKYPNIYSSRFHRDSESSPDHRGKDSNKIFTQIQDIFDELLKRNGNSITEGNVKANVERESWNFSFCGESYSCLRSILFPRKLLVFVNPVSGQGKSANLFQDKVLPVFRDCGIRTHLVQTEYAGHASRFISDFEFGNIDGIISIGGDGLLNEIVNGLRSRESAQNLADIPIGVIATGSGNGLARSLAAYGDESAEYKSNPVLYSSLSVARGCILPVNLAEVSLDGGKSKIFSFLSVGWGIMSDIDIESEVLRYIGEIRFFIWSFLKLAKLRRYKAELSYIPHDSDRRSKTSSRVIVNDEFVSVYSVCQSYIGTTMLYAPDAKPCDGVIHLTYLPSHTGRIATARYLLAVEGDKGQHLYVDPVQYVKVKEFTIRCEGGLEGCLTVDGEQVTGEEITVRLSDTPLNVFGMG